MESVYITEYNKNGVSFHELSLGQYDSDRDYLRDSDRASGGSIRGGDSVFEGGSESVRGDGWGYGTLGGDDADCREVRTSGGDGAENAAGAELSVSGDSRESPVEEIDCHESAGERPGTRLGGDTGRAMEELSDLEEERRRKKQRAVAVGAASNEMCDFLILNISSLQLIPVNIIAFRTEYGSVTPTAIVGPAILATAISTGAAVLYIKTKNWMARPEKANNIFTKMVLKNEKASHIMGESK